MQVTCCMQLCACGWDMCACRHALDSPGSTCTRMRSTVWTGAGSGLHAGAHACTRVRRTRGDRLETVPSSPWELDDDDLFGKARDLLPSDSASSLPGIRAAASSPKPLVFMHGVGLGIVRPPLVTHLTPCPAVRQAVRLSVRAVLTCRQPACQLEVQPT